MSPISRAREAAQQAGQQYGYHVIETAAHLSNIAPDTDQPYITAVSRHISQQASKLIHKGMAAELVQLWKAAATKTATERLREVSPIAKGHKRS